MKKTIHNRLLTLIISIIMITILAGCSENNTVVIENGIASWKAEENAVKYEYVIADFTNTSLSTQYTTETSVQIPEGYCIHVRAVFENGETGDWMISEFYGEPVVGFEPEYVPELDFSNTEIYVDAGYDIKWEDLKSFEVISNIHYDTLKTLEDGSIYFETSSPNGGTMRFVGTGVTVSEGSISFEPNGQITALDAIGRICSVAPTISEPGNNNFVRFTGGFTFTDAVSVDSADELFYIWGLINKTTDVPLGTPLKCSLLNEQPNFISFASTANSTDTFSISELTVYYDETTFNTAIRLMALDYEFYGTYLEGEYYDSSKEVYDSANGIYDFYLMLLPDVANEREPFHPNPLTDMLVHRSIIDIDNNRYTIGDLKDANGNILDKKNDSLSVGCTLEVSLGNYTKDVLVPVIEQYRGAQNLHELTPYNNASATGNFTSLVIPVVWQDEPENATEEVLQTLYNKLGKVVDTSGNVTDYSDNLTDSFSLSKYYDISSYGKHTIQSFVTDWYQAPYSFSEMKDLSVTGGSFMEEISTWVFNTYPDMDYSKFDSDADGFFDSVIIMNVGTVGDSYAMASYSHAVHVSTGYTGETAGTQDKPVIKNFVSINQSFLTDNALIHEYAHGFGLVDYYDVTYSGIDAVGSYDMQSGSYGDWNAYSKYSVGWIEPKIVSQLASGESTEITISSFAKTGDAIVIPAAGCECDGPFNEYILIDLFTSDGVNQYDAKTFGINDTVGVRIYHVNSKMEKRVITGENNIEYPIGTIHFSNAYNPKGNYLLELIQAGGSNTFTTQNSRSGINASDFFEAGDVFSTEKYSKFFTNGLMDDGSEFGYKVEIISIDKNADTPTATIRITAE